MEIVKIVESGVIMSFILKLLAIIYVLMLLALLGIVIYEMSINKKEVKLSELLKIVFLIVISSFGVVFLLFLFKAYLVSLLMLDINESNFPFYLVLTIYIMYFTIKEIIGLFQEAVAPLDRLVKKIRGDGK